MMEKIVPRSKDVSQWYTDVLLKAELADYAPVRGCMVIRPYGYAIWERIRLFLDEELRRTGHQNAYFPLFIPENFLKKEAEHIAGFAPQVAWVTIGGQEKLEEPLAVRPTSETIIYAMYARWIQSYRDLPVLLNQWANVVRWEKTTRPFLRTMEFLWQEGHTAHATEEEAEEEALNILGIYERFLKEKMAIPVIVGRKSEKEKFAGALRTYTVEAMMQDGKALQAGTSHNLGDGFARAFGIQYLDRDGKLKYVWQTSWGVSTRLIGALILCHGDDRGLRLPPEMAPIQVVAVPIYSTEKDRKSVVFASKKLIQRLSKKFRCHLDDRAQYTPGYKFHDWELKGVPVRLEIGPRDIATKSVVLVRRDSGEKIPVPQKNLPPLLTDILREIQGNLFKQAREFMDSHIYPAEHWEELQEGVKTGFVYTTWCGNRDCEDKVAKETTASIRCIALNQKPSEDKPCVVCLQPARYFVYFARAY
ncbi:MAG: proline--tRNA ligase [bacterium JZ-2024 1]